MNKVAITAIDGENIGRGKRVGDNRYLDPSLSQCTYLRHHHLTGDEVRGDEQYFPVDTGQVFSYFWYHMILNPLFRVCHFSGVIVVEGCAVCDIQFQSVSLYFPVERCIGKELSRFAFIERFQYSGEGSDVVIVQCRYLLFIVVEKCFGGDGLGTVPVGIELPSQAWHNASGDKHIKIDKKCLCARYKVDIADIPAAEDGTDTVCHKQFVVHAFSKCIDIEEQGKVSKRSAQSVRVEKAQFDIGVIGKECQCMVFACRTEIIKQYAYLDTTLCRLEKVCRKDVSRKIVFINVVLYIEAASCMVYEVEPCRKGIVRSGERIECGTVL